MKLPTCVKYLEQIFSRFARRWRRIPGLVQNFYIRAWGMGGLVSPKTSEDLFFKPQRKIIPCTSFQQQNKSISCRKNGYSKSFQNGQREKMSKEWPFGARLLNPRRMTFENQEHWCSSGNFWMRELLFRLMTLWLP